MIAESKLITNENPLLVAPQLAAILNSVDAAIILQQIHYWLSTESGRVIDGIRWIYNSLDDWLEQFPWLSKWKLRRAMAILRDEYKIVIFAQHEAKEWKRRGWYTIDYQILESLHTSKCEGANSQENVPPTLEVCTAHTSETEILSESSQKKQQQSAAAFLEKPVEEDCSNQSFATLIDQTELVDDEPELVNEDHFSDVPEPEKLDASEFRQILNEVRAADISLTPELQRLVLKSSVEVVSDALAAMLERRQKGTLRNPAGYLTRAIQGEWKPTVAAEVGHRRRNAIPEEVRPPSDEQLAQLNECKAKGTILDHFFSTIDGIYKVVLPGGFVMKPWWEFLEIFN